MKRNKIIAVAVVVMMVVGAVVLMSCSNCPGDGDCKIDANDMLGSVNSWCFSGADLASDDGQKKVEDCFGKYWDGVTKLTCGC